MSQRVPLPDRRQNQTVEVAFGNHVLTVCMGFDPAAAVREIFVTGHKAGSDMQQIIDDACVIVSTSLQFGIPAEALAKSLGRVPAWRDGVETTAPASPIGAALAAIVDLEAQVAGLLE